MSESEFCFRTTYTFGEGYNSLAPSCKRQGVGGDRKEKLYPKGTVDDIPKWIQAIVIQPLEDAGLVQEEWVNCVTIHDYYNGKPLGLHSINRDFCSRWL